MKPKCFLHAGFHKTGTSAIQRFAATHKRMLAAQGLLYPGLWPESFRPVDGHHFIAHAVAGDERFLTRSQASRLIGRWRRAAKSRGVSVMLSSEAICRLAISGADELAARQEDYLERLSSLLSGFDVRPVLVVRRQDDFVRSLYQEHVAAGTGSSACSSFAHYLSAAAGDKASFLERLRAFQEAFGSVRLLIYEELVDAALPVAFFRALGVRGLNDCKVRKVRPSLSVVETLVKQRLNAWISGRQQNRLALIWLRSRAVQRILQSKLGACNTLWPDLATRTDFLARFEAENDLIAREFLDRNDKLFPPIGQGSIAQVPPPEGEVVVDALQQAARAARWRLQAIVGRRAVSEVLRGALWT